MRLLLVGLSGAGKSTVGRLLAERRGVLFVDLDAEIEARLGATIADIFSQQGERAFRAAELLCLEQLSEIDDAVVALGGGAVASGEGRAAAQSLGTLIWLAISPSEAAARLTGQKNRPLVGQHGASALAQQFLARRGAYAEAELLVDASGSPDDVVSRIEAQLSAPYAHAYVQSHHGPYSLRTARYSNEGLGATLLAHARSTLFVVCDLAVAERAGGIAKAAGAALICVGGGERLKRLDAIETLVVELQRQGADRQALLVAIGGGSVTDAVGFLAACYLRGVDWLSVPSTLLGMVDSGLGGKVGANAGGTKNALGSFYPPLAVINDLSWLDSLPERELRSGVAEMLKVAATHDADYFARLVTRPDLTADDALPLVARAAALKAAVVSADEFEHGERKSLNFGHTLGHAFESAAGLQGLRHGEAVALGMLAETAFFVERGVARRETLTALEIACGRLGLPCDWHACVPGASEFLLNDKKRSGSSIRLPIVPDIGRHTWADVEVSDITRFLEEHGAPS